MSVKIQVTLYEKREKDKFIIEELGLDKCYNVNDKIREILYTIAYNGVYKNYDLANMDIPTDKKNITKLVDKKDGNIQEETVSQLSDQVKNHLLKIKL